MSLGNQLTERRVRFSRRIGLAAARIRSRTSRGAANSPVYSVVLQGGLGNRLFQLASIYGLSRSHGARFVIVEPYIYGNSHSQQSYARYYQCFVSAEVPDFEKYSELPFDALSFVEIPRQTINTLFEGFFQSERYFLHIRKELLQLFGPTRSERRAIKRRWGDLKSAVFVHVRLGDFLGDSLHEVDLAEYYRKCLTDLHRHFGEVRVLVSTDDEQVCREKLPFLAAYEFLREENEIAALYTLASCGFGGICANSTFSWWGAWLNTSPRKRVYLPNTWLADPRYEQRGILMRDSIVVDLETLRYQACS